MALITEDEPSLLGALQPLLLFFKRALRGDPVTNVEYLALEVPLRKLTALCERRIGEDRENIYDLFCLGIAATPPKNFGQRCGAVWQAVRTPRQHRPAVLHMK